MDRYLRILVKLVLGPTKKMDYKRLRFLFSHVPHTSKETSLKLECLASLETFLLIERLTSSGICKLPCTVLRNKPLPRLEMAFCCSDDHHFVLDVCRALNKFSLPVRISILKPFYNKVCKFLHRESVKLQSQYTTPQIPYQTLDVSVSLGFAHYDLSLLSPVCGIPI